MRAIKRNIGDIRKWDENNLNEFDEKGVLWIIHNKFSDVLYFMDKVTKSFI